MTVGNLAERLTAQIAKTCATMNSSERANVTAIVDSALTSVRQEVWQKVFDVVSSEGSYGARQLIKSLETARESDGCGPAS
jgi:hypothetical protein